MTASLGMSQEEATKIPRNEDKSCNLDLKDELSNELIVPAELNTFLLHRIRELKSENGNLRSEIDKTKDSLQKLQILYSPEDFEALKKSSEAGTSKIMELNKSLEQQKMELKIFEAKCKELESQLASKEVELENERLARKVEDEKSIDCTDSTTMTEEYTADLEIQLLEKEERVKMLNEKLQKTNAKLYETKNTCTTLRQEINKAQKLLCREVGSNVTLSSLSNRSSGWQGRAEQVQHLQQKVADLQSKLNENDGSKMSSCSSFAGEKQRKLETVLSEQRNIGYLRNLEKERRQQIENSAKELQLTQNSLENCQKKIQAAKARIRVLENENNNLRMNLTVLKDKSSHDEQLITALNDQLRISQERYREREYESRYQKEKSEATSRELREELSVVKIQVDLMRKKLQERETEIDNLRARSEKVWPAEPAKVLLPSSPARSRADTPRSFRDPNEYVTMSIAAEAERQRLLELVTLLNRRLDKERTETDKINQLLRQERNKSAKLETRLQRLEMERVGMSKVNTGYRSKYSKSFATLASRENLNAEKIQFKLELLEEECLALKARLATVQQDKTTDLEIYKKMLQQARRTFQDAFRGKMSYTGGCHSNVTI